MGGKILTDGEIADRIAQDDGADQDDVILKRSTGGSRRIYHNADDPCFDFENAGYRNGPEIVSRAGAQDRGLAPCKRCIIGFETDGHDRSIYERAKQFDEETHESLADVTLGGDD